MSLDAVIRILDGAGVRYALIGALALAARGAARSTLDIDLLTADARVLDPNFWASLRRDGTPVDVRNGDFDDPLRGVVRIGAEEPIDIVVAKYKWQDAIVQRAMPVEFRNLDLAIPSASDLILLKLFAGGHSDLSDIARLLAIGPIDELIAEVNRELAALPKEMSQRWERLLSELRR